MKVTRPRRIINMTRRYWLDVHKKSCKQKERHPRGIVDGQTVYTCIRFIKK